MNLLVNQLLCWLIESDTDNKIDRVLWLEKSGTFIVTIDIFHPNAQPIWHSVAEIEAAFATNIISICPQDPYASTLLDGKELSKAQRSYCLEAWKAIASIIACGELVFCERERGKLIKQAVRSTGRSEATIRSYLRRYWQGGQTQNALIPHFEKCGGLGKALHN